MKNSHPNILIQPARSSSKCDLPVKIVFLKPDDIGIHEDHDHEKLEKILISILQQGYKGPAISVIESGEKNLFKKAKNQRILTIDSRLDVGIVDGHNRLVAFKLFKILGILRHELIPAQIIPCSSELVFTATPEPSQTPVPIHTIQTINATPGKTLSNQSPSHFRVKFTDGGDDRIREGQPDVIISSDEFLDFTEFNEQKIDHHSEEVSRYIPVNKLKEIFSKAGVLKK